MPKRKNQYKHKNSFQLVCDSDTTFPVNSGFHHELRRNLIWIDKSYPLAPSRRKDIAFQLAIEVGSYIHPAVYGFVTGRGREKCIARVIHERVSGNFVLKLDIEKAFLNVDIKKLYADLKKHLIKKGHTKEGAEKYLKNVFAELLKSNIEAAEFRGLPMGDPCSPILFAFYMTPVMRRLIKQVNAAAFADDWYLFFENVADADAGQEKFIKALQKRGYKGQKMAETQFAIDCKTRNGRQLSLNDKKTQLFSPSEPMPILGIIHYGHLIYPKAGRSTLNFYYTAREVSRLCKSRGTPALKSLAAEIDTLFGPSSSSTENKRHHRRGHLVSGKVGIERSFLPCFTERVSHCDEWNFAQWDFNDCYQLLVSHRWGIRVFENHLEYIDLFSDLIEEDSFPFALRVWKTLQMAELIKRAYPGGGFRPWASPFFNFEYGSWQSLIIQGYTNKEVSNRLAVYLSCVSNHKALEKPYVQFLHACRDIMSNRYEIVNVQCHIDYFMDELFAHYLAFLPFPAFTHIYKGQRKLMEKDKRVEFLVSDEDVEGFISKRKKVTTEDETRFKIISYQNEMNFISGFGRLAQSFTEQKFIPVIHLKVYLRALVTIKFVNNIFNKNYKLDWNLIWFLGQIKFPSQRKMKIIKDAVKQYRRCLSQDEATVVFQGFYDDHYPDLKFSTPSLKKLIKESPIIRGLKVRKKTRTSYLPEQKYSSQN